MFNHAIRGHYSIPKYLSSDHDPLYRFHQWQANLRILEVAKIKNVPYVLLSHSLVERLTEASAGSAWIARCSGQPRILKTSSGISKPTSTTIGRTPHGRGNHPTEQPRAGSQPSGLIDGNLIVEACITRR